jgi:type I restriction enzyme, S subunit
LTRLRVSKDGPIPEWIWYGLAILWNDRYFETRCKRWVNQAIIDKENILSAPIPLPPLEEQKRILNKIEIYFS